MKKLIAFNILAFSATACYADDFVRDYMNRHGTDAPGNYRSVPNGIPQNNGYYQGNVNPYYRNPNYDPGYNPGYNQGYNQGFNQGYNQGYNQNYNQGYNPVIVVPMK